MAEKVLREALETDVVNAAKRNRMTSTEIETLLKEAAADLLKEKPNNLKKLGIDEITHLKGGKNYVAVLVDLETRKPIELLEKRNKETIAKYLRSLSSEILNQIEEVSIYLWVPYKIVVEELMPNAQVVADRFQVMKQINQELDARRKPEKRAAEKLKTKKIREPKIKAIKNSNYPLLKRKENLKEVEKEKLEEIRKVLPELAIIYEEKEKFIDIFDSKITSDSAFWKLLEWTESAYKYFPKSCQTIKR